MHGDRMYADDQAILGGVARLDGRSVMLIGHQKGRDTKERVRRNYGMPKPRLSQGAAADEAGRTLRASVITLIDTPGAYPGVGSEERNQKRGDRPQPVRDGTLRVPVITAVIGEGGSGGALAVGVCDRLIMLQYSVYSVICRRLRVDPLEERGQEGAGGRRDGHHRGAARPARCRRRDPARAARRRASRSPGNGGCAERRAAEVPRRSRGAHCRPARRAALHPLRGQASTAPADGGEVSFTPGGCSVRSMRASRTRRSRRPPGTASP